MVDVYEMPSGMIKSNGRATRPSAGSVVVHCYAAPLRASCGNEPFMPLVAGGVVLLCQWICHLRGELWYHTSFYLT
jgi:hypothetical protein